jgi:hypothetical protein
LRHPEGYNLDEPAESGAQNHENTTAQALTSPLDFTAIPITVKADRAGDTLTMQMSLDVGSLDLVSENDRWTGKLEMAARFATADGKQAGFIISQIAEYNMLPQTYNAAVRDGLNLQITLQIPRNATVLRQLVRNVKSGKVGTLSIPLATESAK